MSDMFTLQVNLFFSILFNFILVMAIDGRLSAHTNKFAVENEIFVLRSNQI